MDSWVQSALKSILRVDPIFESTAWFFATILKFIFTSIFEVKIYEKKSLLSKKFHLQRPIFNNPPWTSLNENYLINLTKFYFTNDRNIESFTRKILSSIDYTKNYWGFIFNCTRKNFSNLKISICLWFQSFVLVQMWEKSGSRGCHQGRISKIRQNETGRNYLSYLLSLRCCPMGY